MSQKGEGKMGSVGRPVKGLCAQSSGQLCSCSEVENPAGKPSNVPLGPSCPRTFIWSQENRAQNPYAGSTVPRKAVQPPLPEKELKSEN